LRHIKAGVAALVLNARLGHGFHPSEDAPPEQVAGTLVLTPSSDQRPFVGRAAPINAAFVVSNQPQPREKLR